MEEFRRKIEEITSISDELWETMQIHMQTTVIKKGEVLIPYARIDTNAYFVAQGSFEASLISANGSKKAIWFYFDGVFDAIVCMDSYFLNQPTKYEVTALEDSIVYSVNKCNIDVWVLEHPSLNEVYRTDIIANFIQVDEIRNHMIAYNPKEFLTYLRNYYPEIFLRIPAKNIAHFMGITPEWYSKIQRELQMPKKKD